MDQFSAFLRCVMCGDRIGVYEPIWLELADGGLHRSSYLNLGDYPALDRSRLWHLECLDPESDPSTRCDIATVSPRTRGHGGIAPQKDPSRAGLARRSELVEYARGRGLIGG